MRTLVTGVAGFIGYHTARRLLENGAEVLGIDNLSDYYDVSLKLARLEQLKALQGFQFCKLDIADRPLTKQFFQEEAPRLVIHLAAQPGVRYSLEAPHAYVDSNLVGFVNILEGCRHARVEHLVFASSSSVYGLGARPPFSVTDDADHPISLYAATKRANELMAHTYAHLFGIPVTGLRFFTVYGPWGRPDMAPSLFANAILKGEPIKVFNSGKMKRDFTYVDDIVEAVLRVLRRIPAGPVPYSLFNIGNHTPVELTVFIELLEHCLGRTTTRILLPMQPGDMTETAADVSDLEREIGFRPATSLETGLRFFAKWYREYYCS
jgi:UDP-glucuronate 4-epimerase